MSKYSLDQFLEACGAAGPLNLHVEHESGTDEYILPQPFALAGTDPRADLRLANGSVPRQAAYLQVLSGRLLCLNLTGAATGRNGRYPQNQWIDPGQAWKCGSVTVRLKADHPGVSTAIRPVRRDDRPPASVEITGGSGGVCRYRVKDPLILIGKSPQCQVRLRDTAVSRFHCALVHTQAGLWAVDLLGRGGIEVNGASARVTRLDEGDVLRVGGFAFRPLLGPPKDLVLRGPEAGAFQIAGLPAAGSVTMPALNGGQIGTDLAPLVSLFAALQQQMAEQFRLTMTGMVDTFRQMHADQMRMVWEELAQIRRLTEEVASLKATQGRLPAASLVARPVETPRPFVAPAEDRQPAARSTVVSTGPSAESRTQPANGVTSQEASPQPNPEVEDDVHAWVSRRVAEVQRERDGRWQKIVSFLTGSPS